MMLQMMIMMREIRGFLYERTGSIWIPSIKTTTFDQEIMEMSTFQENDEKKRNYGGTIIIPTTRMKRYPTKRFVLDMLCDHGETTIELCDLYQNSIVFGCTNDEKRTFTSDILSKRYPECVFFNFDELKEMGPDYFDIIQVHHHNLMINSLRYEIYDYIDEHLQKNGYIVYNYDSIEEMKEVEFFHRGYRSWVHLKRIYFGR
jgi:hypothetical protein